MIRRRRAIAALAVLAALLPAPAVSRSDLAPRSARLEIQDPREGRAPLDIKEVDSGLERQALRFTIVTWASWRTRAILDRGYLMVHLDPRSGRRYYVLLRSSGGRMVGILFRKGSSRDARVETLKVWRSDRASVSVRVPARKLKLEPAGAQYAWRVQALVTDSRCKRVCFDRAPDSGDALDTVPVPLRSS
jgi:hypothetical protein